MRNKLAYGAVLVVFFLLAAAAQWPASALLQKAEDAGGGRWKIGAAEGTLWNGTATLLVAENRFAGREWRAVQKLRWRLRGSDLLRGRLGYDVDLEQGKLLLAVSGGGELALEEVDARLPAAVLASMISGALGRYQWDGILEARASRFACSTRVRDCRGEMDIAWKDAGVAEIPGRLGSYSLHLVGEGPAIHFTLGTLSGRLQLSGKGEVGSGGLRFSGEAAAEGPGASALEAQLRTLGRPAATAGRYIIDYRESMPSQ